MSARFALRLSGLVVVCFSFPPAGHAAPEGGPSLPEQQSYWTLDAIGSGFLVNQEGSPAGVVSGYDFDPEELEAGVQGRALIFDGVDDEASFLDPEIFPRSRGTLGLWLKPASTETSVPIYLSDAPEAEPIDYDGFGSNGDLLEIHVGVGAGWSFSYQDGDGAVPDSGGRFRVTGGSTVVGCWTHVAATWDRSGDLVLYVDCREVDRVSLAGGVFADHPAQEALLGRPSEGGRRWSGSIDEVRVLDGALEPDQVATAFCYPRFHEEAVLTQAGAGEVAFGAEAAIDGDFLAISDPQEDDAGDAAGAVFVYERGASGWNEVAALRPEGRFELGEALDLSGGVLVASSSTHEVFVWERNPSGAWLEAATLTHPSLEPTQSFGASVAVTGDWIAVGSPTPGGGEGDVRLYQRSPGGTWSFVEELVHPSANPDERWGFGYGVALDDDLLAVYSASDQARRGMGVPTEGTVYLYELAGTWQPDGSVVTPPPFFGSQAFGLTMDLDDGRLVVGEFPAGFSADDTGRAFVFERNARGTIQWGLLARLQAPVPTAYEELGTTVALAGRWAAVGGNAGNSTPVYLFRLPEHDGGAAYLQPTFAYQTTPGLRRGFGESVVMSGRDLVIGAPTDQQEPGGALLYSLPLFVDGFESGATGAWSTASP